MLIGIMSDSHDRLDAIDAAVALFNERKVDFVLHAGDHISPFAVRRYQKLDADWAGVFGNNDGEREGLMSVSQGRISSDHLHLELGGKVLLLVHRELDALDLVEQEPSVQVVVFGHDHMASSDLRDQGRWWINPGETCGYLTGRCTVALLDLDKMQVEHVELEA